MIAGPSMSASEPAVAAAQAGQLDVGQVGIAVAVGAVGHAGVGLEVAQLAGVDVDLAARRGLALVAAGEEHRDPEERDHPTAHQLGPSVRTSFSASTGSVGPVP